jgi:hypothetical protein
MQLLTKVGHEFLPGPLKNGYEQLLILAVQHPPARYLTFLVNLCVIPLGEETYQGSAERSPQFRAVLEASQNLLTAPQLLVVPVPGTFSYTHSSDVKPEVG